MTLAIRPVGPQERVAMRAFLEAHTDPVEDLLLHADVDGPLSKLARVWLLARGGKDVALAFAFDLWADLPALGLKGITAADEAEALAALVAAGHLTHGYVICPLAQRALWEGAGTADAGHQEAHMVLAADAWSAPALQEAVRGTAPLRAGSGPYLRPALPEEAVAFYTEHRAGAFHPVQLETGPYVVCETGGAIVAAAGTHFSYPRYAQIGNVLTAEGHRGQGYATLCTAAIVGALISRGHPMVGLFVDTENVTAVRLYERLGFRNRGDRAAFRWAVNGLTTS